jgi:hypothetical protein
MIAGDVRFYKGCYPVRIVALAGPRHCRVVCLAKFLHTWKTPKKLNPESKMLKPGDEITVLGSLLWTDKKKMPTGKRNHVLPEKRMCD